MTNSPLANDMANAIRSLAMDAVEKANSGHPGLPMGCADVATVLFTKVMKFDPRNPEWPDRDRFVLSAGHGSMLLYASLYLLGYEDATIDQIKNFRQLGSKTAGPSRARFPQGHRDDHGAAGAGHRKFRRHGGRGSQACGGVRERCRRSSYLVPLRRWLPDGGHFAGGDLARRASEAQQADADLGQ